MAGSGVELRGVVTGFGRGTGRSGSGRRRLDVGVLDRDGGSDRLSGRGGRVHRGGGLGDRLVVARPVDALDRHVGAAGQCGGCAEREHGDDAHGTGTEHRGADDDPGLTDVDLHDGGVGVVEDLLHRGDPVQDDRESADDGGQGSGDEHPEGDAGQQTGDECAWDELLVVPTRGSRKASSDAVASDGSRAPGTLRTTLSHRAVSG